MTKTIFMDKYPVYSIEIDKSETIYKSIDEIINYFRSLIEKHPVATYISIFDHYKHTSLLKDGVINPDIKGAKNLIFCFGKQLPKTTMLAIRPRSIGICELNNSFMIEFMEVPNEQLQETTKNWVVSIKNNQLPPNNI